MIVMENQKGVGLIQVVLAAGLVVVIALAVSHFVVNQTDQSVKLQISGSCQNIANSVVEYINKDESSLFISSHGPIPGTKNFASNMDKTDDDLDRYVFNGVSTPLFIGPANNQMSLNNGALQSLPANWKYFNHLNIKNSANRLTALAANGNFCCTNLDVNNPNCGDIFISDTLPRSGFQITEKNVEVKLGVDFKSATNVNLCTSRKLTLANLIDSKFSGTINFQVLVTVGKGTPNEKTCTAQRSVQQSLDSVAPLTLLELQNNAAMCGGKNGLPSNCNAASDVVYKVKTVKNSAGNTCEDNCLEKVLSKTCSNISPGSLSLFNSFSHASCTANCPESEPGSSFLCKVGEKNWFNKVSTANHWEPCEVAKVYDFDDSVIPGAKVTIEYLPLYNDLRSEVTTNATITLSGLSASRAYVLDVRAVDTKGNIGPSFCSTSPSSCDINSNPHFVVAPNAPIIGAITDNANYVNTAGQAIGKNTTLISTPKYSNALSPFGANRYQCQNGSPDFFVPVDYGVPAGAFNGFVMTSCSASLTLPSGASSNPNCTCSGGGCESLLPVSALNGAYQFSMTITNDCGGGAGTVKNQNWCMDNNVAIGMTNGGNQSFGPTPDFSTFVNYPTVATKACGVVSLCPNVNGGFTPTLGSCPNATINWDPMVHSGCLGDPANNYCMLAMDPCGRSQSTNPIKYTTTLKSVLWGAGVANNMCYVFGGSQVCGNVCEPGSYCSAGGKCYSSCASPPCPSNSNTPAAANSGAAYCPTLNSCPVSIGGTPSGAGCASAMVIGLCNPATDGGSFSSPPNSNLCTSGTPSGVGGPASGPWTWSCAGSGGGGTANCSATFKPPTGSCGWVEVDRTMTDDGSCDGMVGSGPVRPPNTPCTTANKGAMGNWAGCKGSNLLDVDFVCECP
jgi:hypothetical protein